MKSYESVFIISSRLSDEERNGLLSKYQEIIAANEGEVVKTFLWGNRRLAYPINKQEFGIYHVWYIKGTGNTLSEWHRQCGYDEGLLRIQTVGIRSIEEEAEYFCSLNSSKDVGSETEASASEDSSNSASEESNNSASEENKDSEAVADANDN